MPFRDKKIKNILGRGHGVNVVVIMMMIIIIIK